MDHLNVAFEVKALDENTDDSYFYFEGFAAAFENTDNGLDVIHKGAFVESIRARMPTILWIHNRNEPIGMPLSIEEVDDGLYIKARLPKEDTLVNGRVMPQMRVGSVRSMSIGYVAVDHMRDDQGIRHLYKIDLREVSLVPFPMNDMAMVTNFKSLLLPATDDKGCIDTDKAKEVIQDLDCFTPEYKSRLCEIVSQNPDSLVSSQLFLKYITKSDLEFLDDIKEFNPRTFERALRDAGLFSKTAATKFVSFLCKCDTSTNDQDNEELDTEVKKLNGAFQQSEIQCLLQSIHKKLEPHNAK